MPKILYHKICRKFVSSIFFVLKFYARRLQSILQQIILNVKKGRHLFLFFSLNSRFPSFVLWLSSFDWLSWESEIWMRFPYEICWSVEGLGSVTRVWGFFELPSWFRDWVDTEGEREITPDSSRGLRRSLGLSARYLVWYFDDLKFIFRSNSVHSRVSA